MKKLGLDWGRGDLAGVTPNGVNPHLCPSGGTGRAPGAGNPQKFRFRKPRRPAENSLSSKGLRAVNIFRCCATISTCSDAPTRDSLLKEIRPCRIPCLPPSPERNASSFLPWACALRSAELPIAAKHVLIGVPGNLNESREPRCRNAPLQQHLTVIQLFYDYLFEERVSTRNPLRPIIGGRGLLPSHSS